MIDSFRLRALTDLISRLGFIQISKGYNTDAGLHIWQGEAPQFGEGDPTAALLVLVGADSPTQSGPRILARVPVEVQACVPADLGNPLLSIEAIVADIKVAVEIEGRDQNAVAGSASIDRSLDGTLPTGLERGPTRPIPRVEGSTYVGASVEYVLTIEEQWGLPGDGDAP